MAAIIPRYKLTTTRLINLMMARDESAKISLEYLQGTKRNTYDGINLKREQNDILFNIKRVISRFITTYDTIEI